MFGNEDGCHEREFPTLLHRLRKKRLKKSQDTFRLALGITTRQRVSNIERGLETPAELTQIVRTWLELGGVDPKGKTALRFCLEAGYPLDRPTCQFCLEEVVDFLAERAVHCPHAEARIPPEERAMAAARRNELLVRKPGHTPPIPSVNKESKS